MIQLNPNTPDLDIDALVLKYGKHNNRDEGMCLMEASSVAAGGPFTDHHESICPILGAFLRSLNDRLPDDERQQLKRYVLPLVGSKGSKALEQRRSWALTDWVVRECAPIWLRRAGMEEQAVIMESIAPITSQSGYQSVKPAILAVRNLCWEKRDGWRQKIAEAVKAELEKRGLSAAADAAAADVAAAAADVAAAAADVAVADAAAAVADAAVAAADAAVAAAVAAVAAAVAAVAAAAADVAAAAADADVAVARPRHLIYGAVWRAVYDKLREIYRAKFGDTRAMSLESVHGLVQRLLDMKD